MTEYNTSTEQAEFDENGFCSTAGWARIYHYSEFTYEYHGTSMEYIPVGFGVPGSSTTEKPLLEKEGFAIIRDIKNNTWHYIVDFRGITVYSQADRTKVVVDYLGEIKAGYTTKKPPADFVVWNGSDWEVDVEAEKAFIIAENTNKKKIFADQASEQIELLSYAVELEMATDEEKLLLMAWKKYRVLLNRVNVNDVNAVFPEIPDFA